MSELVVKREDSKRSVADISIEIPSETRSHQLRQKPNKIDYTGDSSDDECVREYRHRSILPEASSASASGSAELSPISRYRRRISSSNISQSAQSATETNEKSESGSGHETIIDYTASDVSGHENTEQSILLSPQQYFRSPVSHQIYNRDQIDDGPSLYYVEYARETVKNIYTDSKLPDIENILNLACVYKEFDQPPPSNGKK